MTGASWEERRVNRFPNGENLDDVAKRADEVFERVILPWAILADKEQQQAKEQNRETNQLHVIIVAHGIMISELSQALVRKSVSSTVVPTYRFGGVTNTGWHRFQIGLTPRLSELSPEDAKMALDAARQAVQNGTDVFPELPFPTGHPWRVNVKLLATNTTTHLTGLTRQKGGIGSSAHDAKQTSVKDFFSGGGVTRSGSSA